MLKHRHLWFDWEQKEILEGVGRISNITNE